MGGIENFRTATMMLQCDPQMKVRLCDLANPAYKLPRHWKADTNRANLLRENVVIGRIPRAIVQWLCNEFCRGRARQNWEGLCFQLERLGVGDGD